MARSEDTQIVRVLHPICCGLDVHKKSISACFLTVDAEGNDETEIREFATFTKDLIELRNWLLEKECPKAQGFTGALFTTLLRDLCRWCWSTHVM